MKITPDQKQELWCLKLFGEIHYLVIELIKNKNQ